MPVPGAICLAIGEVTGQKPADIVVGAIHKTLQIAAGSSNRRTVILADAASSAFAADFDQDGKLDVALSNHTMGASI